MLLPTTCFEFSGFDAGVTGGDTPLLTLGDFGEVAGGGGVGDDLLGLLGGAAEDALFGCSVTLPVVFGASFFEAGRESEDGDVFGLLFALVPDGTAKPLCANASDEIAKARTTAHTLHAERFKSLIFVIASLQLPNQQRRTPHADRRVFPQASAHRRRGLSSTNQTVGLQNRARATRTRTNGEYATSSHRWQMLRGQNTPDISAVCGA